MLSTNQNIEHSLLQNNTGLTSLDRECRASDANDNVLMMLNCTVAVSLCLISLALSCCGVCRTTVGEGWSQGHTGSHMVAGSGSE